MLSYEEFTELHFERAKCHSADRDDIAEKICREAYASLGEDDDPYDNRMMIVRFVEVYYEKYAQVDSEEETARVAELLFGKASVQHDGRWLAFGDTLALLKPILLDLPLTDRIIAGLRILGWGNDEIAKCFEACMPDIRACLSLDGLIGGVRKCLREQFWRLERNRDWLCVLVAHGGALVAQAEDARVIINLAAKKDPWVGADRRDRFSWLRNRFQDRARQALRRSIRLEDLMRRNDDDVGDRDGN